jgi:malonyl-CoA O-methyltransferase
MIAPSLPEKPAVRRSFERAAATYDGSNVLQLEVGQRLLAHLDPIRIEPARIVDLGCGTGASFGPLQARYPHARLVGVDFAHAMTRRAMQRTPSWRRLLRLQHPHVVCGDAERLPLASGSAQLIFSNLALQWCKPDLVFTEAARVLQPGGLMLFSTFGPDTLKELRAAFGTSDGAEHVNRFVDMHDLGDMLVHAGLADPVVDMEVITLEYTTVEALMHDLKAIGARNSLPGRPRGLSGQQGWRDMVARYEAQRRNGALPASYEVIYGHAWKVAPRKLPDGRQVIDFRPRSSQ